MGLNSLNNILQKVGLQMAAEQLHVFVVYKWSGCYECGVGELDSIFKEEGDAEEYVDNQNYSEDYDIYKVYVK